MSKIPFPIKWNENGILIQNGNRVSGKEWKWNSEFQKWNGNGISGFQKWNFVNEIKALLEKS